MQFGSAAERKQVLGAAVLSVLRRFLEGTDPVASFRALADAGAGGHLIVHSTDPEVQAALEAAGVAGTVEAPAGDLFGAFASNADGTKIDFYVRRSLSYRVDLGEGGGSTAQVALTAENTAPTDPERGYVFGPYPGTGLEPGGVAGVPLDVLRPRLRIPGRHPRREATGPRARRERGLSVFSTYVQTAPGTTSELALELQRADAWTGDELRRDLPARDPAQQTVLPTRGTIDQAPRNGHRRRHAGHAGRGRPGDVGGRPRRRAGLRDPVQRQPIGRFWDWLSTPVFGD